MQNKSLVALRISLTCLALLICAVSLFGYPLLHTAAPSQGPVLSVTAAQNQTVTTMRYNTSVYTQAVTSSTHNSTVTRTLTDNQTLTTTETKTLPGHYSTVTTTTTKYSCTPHPRYDCD